MGTDLLKPFYVNGEFSDTAYLTYFNDEPKMRIDFNSLDKPLTAKQARKLAAWLLKAAKIIEDTP